MLNQQGNEKWNQAVLVQIAPRELIIDADVRLVASYLMDTIEASKLVSVAEAVAQLAPLLWGHHERTDVRALKLQYPPITTSPAEHKQPVAT